MRLDFKELALRAGWAPASVVLLHSACAALVGHPPMLDLLMHPLGGLAVAYALHTAVPMLAPVLGSLTAGGRSVLVLGGSFVVANLWEYTEFAADMLFGTRIQISLNETMVDLLLGTGAAALFVFVAHLRMVRAGRGS